MSTAESPSLRFYDNDESLARMVAEFLRDGFEHGSPGVVIATDRQRAEIVRELAACTCDVAALQHSHALLLLDADEILSAIMVDGKPDGRKFSEEIGRLIESARKTRPNGPVRMFGQMVDLLWQRGDRTAAIGLELLWNRLARTEAASLVCGYAIGNFYKNARLGDVSARQSRSVPKRRASRRSTAADSSQRRSKRKSHR